MFVNVKCLILFLISVVSVHLLKITHVYSKKYRNSIVTFLNYSPNDLCGFNRNVCC